RAATGKMPSLPRPGDGPGAAPRLPRRQAARAAVWVKSSRVGPLRAGPPSDPALDRLGSLRPSRFRRREGGAFGAGAPRPARTVNRLDEFHGTSAYPCRQAAGRFSLKVPLSLALEKGRPKGKRLRRLGPLIGLQFVVLQLEQLGGPLHAAGLQAC